LVLGSWGGGFVEFNSDELGMMMCKGTWIGLLPLAALADGIHSGDSGAFSLDTGGQPADSRWVSAEEVQG
jgi:hypothetical protein